jgi:hypothetical protein
MYQETSEQREVSIPWSTFTPPANPINEDSQEQISVGGPTTWLNDPGFSHMMPYRVIREGVLKISSTAMDGSRTGALYYVDLSLIGLGVREEFNISKLHGLEMFGERKIAGYTFEVEKSIFTFSTEEQTSIVLPRSVLPVGSTPDLDNEISLAGQNLQVNYDSAPLVGNIQNFFNSPLDRVIVSNTLVRHFLPTYVFLDVTYVGGDSEAVVAEAIIKYIDTIDPNVNELVADDVAEIIRRRGASQVRLPINLIALTHGTDRRIRGAQSQDLIGGTSLPTFAGNFNQVYFIAGPDTSEDETRPSGEQVYLIRL